VDEEIDLTPFAGRMVLLRFEYVTDEAANGGGMAVDDISVPEIGFGDDAEQDGGWQAAGFRRVAAPVPARYLIQLVTEGPDGWSAQRIPVEANGTAEVRIRGAQGRAAVIIAAVTYGTDQAAPYRWEFGPAGG
jgi:immune inhibitor A